ncbi:MAG: hypothetical protein LBF86_00030 [Helicobacteraceae bacterium]|nr:hypothetical protein [Helicobacteraceae bacterium]
MSSSVTLPSEAVFDGSIALEEFSLAFSSPDCAAANELFDSADSSAIIGEVRQVRAVIRAKSPPPPLWIYATS